MPQVKHRLNVGKNLHGCRAFQSANDLDAAQLPLPTGTPVGNLIPTVIGQLFFATATGITFISTGLTAADWVRLGSGNSLFSEGQEQSTNNAALTTINSFTLLGGTLGAQGDTLRFDLAGFMGATGVYLMELDIGGEVIVSLGVAATNQYRFQIELVRYTNVTWRLQGRHWQLNGSAPTATPSTYFGGAGDILGHRYAGTADLDSDQLIRFRARNSTSADLFTSEIFRLALA